MTITSQHAPVVRALPPPAVSLWLAAGARRALLTVVLPLLAVAGAAWIITVRSASDGMLTLGGFLLSWLIMMVAMMLPSAAPVVALYALAARRRVVAPVPVFVAGYLCVWTATGLPAYAVAQALAEPLMNGESWVARLVGGTLVAAALYQLTPLKDACLRRCRSPLSFYLARTGGLTRWHQSFAAGAQHGLYCLGCCWALMAVLVAVGGMQLGWALALALVISAEKLLPSGRLVVSLTAVATAGLGAGLLLAPTLIDHLIRM